MIDRPRIDGDFKEVADKKDADTGDEGAEEALRGAFH
jgi:hypothetical protein